MITHSGIYAVHHGGDHRAHHDIALLAGRLFPQCSFCGDAVRYELVHAAPYIFDDSDFRAAAENEQEKSATRRPWRPRG